MSRPVTADHVLFDECIAAFRQNAPEQRPFAGGKSISYLLTSFEIPQPWQLPHCLVQPSVQVDFPGSYAAFVSRVENPEWVGSHNPHLYGIALSSVVSFSTGRPCRSTRDGYRCRDEPLSDDEREQLGLLHPVLVAGPGGINTTLPTEKWETLSTATYSLIAKLQSLPYETYAILMQAIRLVHLSLLNKRDDFGLAYLLLVSAVESIAQHAVKRDKVKVVHPSEAAWESRATKDDEFKKLLTAYRELRGQNQYLKERYIEFIKEFAPIEIWDQIVPHPLQDTADCFKERAPSIDMSHLVQKSWYEKYPKDLSPQQIQEILSDSYAHRSYFIHRGKQPPHRDATSSTRFFQEVYDFDGMNEKIRLLPNYELLLGIAQKSITAWANFK